MQHNWISGFAERCFK